jgi:hypothetical protein
MTACQRLFGVRSVKKKRHDPGTASAISCCCGFCYGLHPASAGSATSELHHSAKVAIPWLRPSSHNCSLGSGESESILKPNAGVAQIAQRAEGVELDDERFTIGCLVQAVEVGVDAEGHC